VLVKVEEHHDANVNVKVPHKIMAAFHAVDVAAVVHYNQEQLQNYEIRHHHNHCQAQDNEKTVVVSTLS